MQYIPNILSFGFIGLAFLLVYMSNKSLVTYYKRDDQNSTPFYVHTLVILILGGLGFTLQFSDSETKSELEEVRNELERVDEQLTNLLDLKGGDLIRLQQIEMDDGDKQLFNTITERLTETHEMVLKVLRDDESN